VSDELFPTAIERGATISPCEKYRWSLSRRWDPNKNMLGWIMLNPSTADASVDDPTIRRCIRFARDWGYGGIIVTNLFPYRATDPSELRDVANLFGADAYPAANAAAFDLILSCNLICVAWGSVSWEPAQIRARAVLHDLAAHKRLPVCLGMTADKSPRHPLYVRADAIPFAYTAFLGGAA
jgi:hypothetical protein